MSQPISVAIIGGGLAGCTLANGLLLRPNIRFDLFESKSSLGERGAGVGLAINAQNALREMGMDPIARITNAGGVKMKSTYCLIGQGEHRGKTILELPGGIMTVARDLWLQELVKALPQEQLHTNKKLEKIVEAEGKPYILCFTDGSSHQADAVIGCDGIHSKIRQVILGESHPATAPVFGGYWDARGVLSTEQAIKQFGTDLFDPSKSEEVAVVGDGAFMLFAPMSGGRVYNAIVSATAGTDWDTSAWKTDLSRGFLEKTYRGWDEKFKEGVIDALLAEDAGPRVMFSQWESPEAPTYFRGRICMMGDSAHATTPWMGSGAGMATEDCCVLANLLGEVQSTADLDKVFIAFDQVRRGRPEYVVRTSQRIGKLLTGQEGLDPKGVEHLKAASWWDSIWGLDMKAHVQAALDLYASA